MSFIKTVCRNCGCETVADSDLKEYRCTNCGSVSLLIPEGSADLSAKRTVRIPCGLDYDFMLNKGKKVFERSPLPTQPAAAVGDIISFGKYHGEIKWIVIDKKDDSVLLLSKHIIDIKPYSSFHSASTWETSAMREWLNGFFYNNAFTQEEKERIIVTSINDYKNLGISGRGFSTDDKIFLLSMQEVQTYFPTDEARRAVPAEGCLNSAPEINHCWWLRMQRVNTISVPFVQQFGQINVQGMNTSNSLGVRPAMWLRSAV